MILRRLFGIAILAVFVFLPLHASQRRRAVPTKQDYTVHQIEHYLSDSANAADNGIAFIRPGLKIVVNSVTIGSDRRPVVDLSLTDNVDQPLDRLGKITPGAIALNFTMAWYNPATREYTSYTTRVQTSAPTSPHPGVSAAQASTDSGGTFSDLETGHVKYTFRTVLPANFDQTKTHTVGIYATRNLTTEIGKTYFANAEFDFRPDGANVTETWAKINQATSCNNCHDPLSAHGGARQDIKLCVMCHQSQTIDPDTGHTMDMKVMAHKIHMGKELPSVLAGTPYAIIGYNATVLDFSTVGYPQDIRNCANCHEGTNAAQKPAQATLWMTQPSRAVCGSCHDNIDWTTGAHHPGGAQANDSACAACHVPDSGQEFDASVKGAHLVPMDSKQLKGLKVAITGVSNFSAGKKPTVVLKITNTDGSAVDGSKLNAFAPMIAGPTSSYTTYYRESAVGKAVFDATAGTSTYTFTNSIPADAKGTWSVSADAYRNVSLKRADGKADVVHREAAVNPVRYFSLTGGPPSPRRLAVTISQCNVCHDTLALHGEQRVATEECVICHNPTAGDEARRPATAGPPESISFQRMIHRIHTGEKLTQDYTIYGFGGTPNNFNEVRFPGDRRNCDKCHLGLGNSLPLQTGIDPVKTLRDYFSPQGPATAACLGCHDGQDAAAHAYLNTVTFPGGTRPSEACATCHGIGRDWDVDKVHAR